METKKTNESSDTKQIGEEELEQVSGGWSENRYDPNICGKLTAPRSECRNVMLTKDIALYDRWCDHFRVSGVWTEVKNGYEYKNKTISCVMNGFPAYNEVWM